MFKPTPVKWRYDKDHKQIIATLTFEYYKNDIHYFINDKIFVSARKVYHVKSIVPAVEVMKKELHNAIHNYVL